MTLYAFLLAGLVLASGLSAGVFLAFSDFIMRGLGQAAPAAGAAGMIGVNRAVLRSLFLTTFFIMVPLGVGLVVWAPPMTPDLVRGAVLMGALVYGVAVVLVTMARNVPMNNALAGSDDPDGYWLDYLRSWTAWNHVRTLGATLSFALFMLALAVLI